MNNKFVNTLWGSAVAFMAVRYLCAAILTAGSKPDAATFQMALDALGPFLPVMSLTCLLGGLLLMVTDIIVARRKK